MTILPEWLRNKLIVAAKQYMKTTCTIEQEVVVTGEFAQPVKNWQVVASNAPCRVITVGSTRGTSAVNEAGAQENLQQEYRLEVTVDIALSVNQRVMVDGEQYNIVRIEKALTDELFHQAIMTRRG